MQETESLDDRWDRRNEYVPVELPRHTVKIELHAVVPKGLHLAILYHPLFETRMDAGEPCGEILIDKTSCRIFVVSRFETVLVLFPQEVPEAVSMQVSDLLIESISPAKISVVSLIRSCHVISHNEATPGQVYFLSTNSKSSLECSEALPAPSLLQRVPASMLHASVFKRIDAQVFAVVYSDHWETEVQNSLNRIYRQLNIASLIESIRFKRSSLSALHA